MQMVISGCKQCIKHEGICAKAFMQPIVVSIPLEVLHVDFTSIETMMELDQPPNMVNLLQPLYKTCYGICDAQSNSRNCC